MRQSLLRVYEKLKCPELFLLDRCRIVNIRHIRRIQHDVVFMVSGPPVLSSTENIRRLKDYLSSYWRNYL